MSVLEEGLFISMWEQCNSQEELQADGINVSKKMPKSHPKCHANMFNRSVTDSFIVLS